MVYTCGICKKELPTSEIVSHDCSDKKYIIGTYVCDRCGREDLSWFELDFGHECQEPNTKEESDHDERINDLENMNIETRLLNLEKSLAELSEWTRADEDRVYQNISKLEKAIEELSTSHEKKPYKCPVCEGSGRINLSKPLVIDHSPGQSTFFSMDCVPCKETGIVWG